MGGLAPQTMPSTFGIAERVSQLGRPPFRRGIKKRASLQAERQRQRRGLSLMSCHPRAAVSSEPVAEQIKTVPLERGGGREGDFNTSAKIGPRALSGSYLDSGDPALTLLSRFKNCSPSSNVDQIPPRTQAKICIRDGVCKM